VCVCVCWGALLVCCDCRASEYRCLVQIAAYRATATVPTFRPEPLHNRYSHFHTGWIAKNMANSLSLSFGISGSSSLVGQGGAGCEKDGELKKNE